MAIALEFIDFVVPISVINEQYPGGWLQCLSDYQNLIGKTVWYDEHLFRRGAMDWQVIESRVEHWREMGFQVTDRVDGQLIWKDVCVIESMIDGPTLPCHWLEYNPLERYAYLRGTSPGTLVHRDNVRSHNLA